MAVQMGVRTLEMGNDLHTLRESNDLLGDVPALRQRMAEDGYLLMRGLIDREAVATARQRILEYAAEQQALTPGRPVLEGAMPRDARSVSMMGRKGISHDPAVLGALEHPALFDFWSRYHDEPVLTFDYKWLRAVGHEEFTGAHYDIVYMGRGSDRLHSCWIPFGDIEVEQGTLAICVGSHNQPGFEKLRRTYGRMDVDRDRVGGWFTDDPLEMTQRFGGRWATTDYRMGDVLMFGMYTMHASTTNTTDRYRLSCDVRFQPVADPVDDRWCGENPRGHYRWMSEPEKVTPMDQARAAWGV